MPPRKSTATGSLLAPSMPGSQDGRGFVCTFVLAAPGYLQLASAIVEAAMWAQIDKNSITIGGQQQYHCIVMAEFLTALAGEDGIYRPRLYYAADALHSTKSIVASKAAHGRKAVVHASMPAASYV